MHRGTDGTGPRAAVRGVNAMAKDQADKIDDEAGEGGADAAEAPAKKKIPMMFIGAVVAVLLIGGVVTAVLLMGHKSPSAHAAAPKKEEKKKDDKKKDDKNGAQIADGPDGVVFYTPPEISPVNMQTADGRPTFLKLKVTFELPDHATADVLDDNMPRIQDMFQTFLRELRPEDLSGSQGTYQLRMELLRRVNLVIAPARVNSVLIEEMLIN